jgi:UDP-glucose 4-epimerase
MAAKFRPDGSAVRVLVTGAFGFVGNAVVRHLAEWGHEVWALTSRPPGTAPASLPVARVLHADVRDRDALRPALDGVEGVCHLAALTNTRESFDQAAEYLDVNATSTGVLLDLLEELGARGTRPPRFVLASTAAVYGTPARQPITEDTPTDPGNPYGRSKVLAEQVLVQRGAEGRVRGTVLRGFNIAGAVAGVGDRDESRIIPKALAVAAGRYPELGINGDGTAVRHFVHVADFARAFGLALTTDADQETDTERGARIYNVGATAVSMREIVTAVETHTGRPVPVQRNPPTPESPRSVADTALIRNELGWRAERSSLETMIADAWDAESGRAASPRTAAAPRTSGP